MYAIHGNINHQYTPNVSIYTSTMDPMGNGTMGFSSLPYAIGESQTAGINRDPLKPDSVTSSELSSAASTRRHGA